MATREHHRFYKVCEKWRLTSRDRQEAVFLRSLSGGAVKHIIAGGSHQSQDLTNQFAINAQLFERGLEVFGDRVEVFNRLGLVRRG